MADGSAAAVAEGGGDHQVSVYFSTYGLDKDYPTHWYTFDMNNGDDTDDDEPPIPKLLSPVSKTNHLPFDSTVVGLGTVMYALGGGAYSDGHGFGPSIVLNHVYVFDGADPSRGWVRGPDMQVAREQPTAFVVDGKIYVMGCLVYSKRRKIDPDAWAEFLDPTVGCWKLLSSSQIEPILSILGGPTSDFNIRSLAVGQQQVLLSSEYGACVYDVVDGSVREMDLGCDFMRFTGDYSREYGPVALGRTLFCYCPAYDSAFSLDAYDTDRKLQINVPVRGLKAVVRPIRYCEHWEDYSPPDCFLRAEGFGLSKNSSNDDSGIANLYLLWLGERIHDGFFAIHCIKIEISKGTDTQGAPQIHACVKSSKSYKFPGDPQIYGGLILRTEKAASSLRRQMVAKKEKEKEGVKSGKIISSARRDGRIGRNVGPKYEWKLCDCGVKARIKIDESERASKGNPYYVCADGYCKFVAWCQPYSTEL